MLFDQTLQTIAFCAYLRESKNFRPFLIVCPLSVLHNWVDEFDKFAPTVCFTLLGLFALQLTR
jgi:ATP-dependent DNA helicase